MCAMYTRLDGLLKRNTRNRPLLMRLETITMMWCAWSIIMAMVEGQSCSTDVRQWQVQLKSGYYTIRPLYIGARPLKDGYSSEKSTVSLVPHMVSERHKVLVGGRPTYRAPLPSDSSHTDPDDPNACGGRNSCGTVTNSQSFEALNCRQETLSAPLPGGRSREILRTTFFRASGTSNFSIVSEVSYLRSGPDVTVSLQNSQGIPMTETYSADSLHIKFTVNNWRFATQSYTYFDVTGENGQVETINNATTLEMWFRRTVSVPNAPFGLRSESSSDRQSHIVNTTAYFHQDRPVWMRSEADTMHMVDGVGYRLDATATTSSLTTDIPKGSARSSIRRGFDVGKSARWATLTTSLRLQASIVVPDPPVEKKPSFSSQYWWVYILIALFVVSTVLLIVAQIFKRRRMRAAWIASQGPTNAAVGSAPVGQEVVVIEQNAEEMNPVPQNYPPHQSSATYYA